jgi:hypothetical protein
MRSVKFLLGLVLVAAPAVLGCGQNGPTVCCDSGSYYSCDNENDLQECFAGQPLHCKRDASKDNLCQNQ